jgi:thiosulfate dehydrogenase
MISHRRLAVIVLAAFVVTTALAGGPDSLLLIRASTTMVTAWTIPRNPITDSLLAGSPDAEQIRWGYRLFINTREEAPHFTKNALTCGNCHLNAGQRELAMPVVGVSTVFPEYNNRAGRLFTLEDRIVGCFTRSENATGILLKGGTEEHLPVPESKEVAALAAYIRWLSDRFSPGDTLPWRGQNTILREHRIPIGKLNPPRGRALFVEKCASCHGKDGRGVQIGDKKAGPLWGPDSWNDGAGAARVYTLAGIIRFAMPYLNPGSLTDEEAQQISAYINSMPRPSYPFKERDYRVDPLPLDAVYYNKGAR